MESSAGKLNILQTPDGKKWIYANGKIEPYEGPLTPGYVPPLMDTIGNVLATAVPGVAEIGKFFNKLNDRHSASNPGPTIVAGCCGVVTNNFRKFGSSQTAVG